MEQLFSEFHAIDGLSSAPDAHGMTKEMFGQPRHGPVAPTILRRGDGLTIALPTFEFGLVLAGAVSAGAYTAGVVDYLIETLDGLEKQRRADFAAYGMDFARWSVPPHAVRLVAVAGASAGSVVGATLAVTAHGRFPPGELSPAIAPQTPHRPGKAPPPHDNPLYNIWVRQLDIRPMLDIDDLDRIGTKAAKNPATGRLESAFARLGSVLNVGALERAAQQTIDFRLDPPEEPRSWLSREVRFAFTIGNLRGVPYRYQLVGLEGARFATTRHADLFHFTLDGASGNVAIEGEEEAPADATGAGATPDATGAADARARSWAMVANAALASAAFPVALQARWMRKPGSCANDVVRLYPRLPESDPENRAWVEKAMLHAGYVNTTDRPGPLSFAAVDGGTMNNQPFEFVERALSGPLAESPTDGALADRATILIDPFPAPPEKEQEQKEDPRAGAGAPPLLDVLPGLLAAYTAQARYDANDRMLAADKDVYNQYMLSPMRADPTPGSWKTFTGAEAIASGGLGAFAGFLSEAFRHHDFLLGRRNAENFLRNYFSLTAENPLFRTPARIGDEGPEQPVIRDFWSDKGTDTAPEGPYWTITCDGEGSHERQILPVPIARDEWGQHQPATGLPYLTVTDPDERLRMERDRKLAVRARLRSPTPVWPDPPARARALMDELTGPILARVDALVRLALVGLGKGGVAGFFLGLARPLIRRGLASLLTARIQEMVEQKLGGADGG